MSAPTPVVREVTYARDGNCCVSCGTSIGLSYQHRAVDGMGGRLAKPLLEEGVTACLVENEDFEHRLQGLALARGWKVKTWVRDRGLMAAVPVFYAWERRWCELTRDGLRVPISAATAVRQMREVYGPAWDEMEAAA